MSRKAGADAVKFQIFDTDSLLKKSSNGTRMSEKILEYKIFLKFKDCIKKKIIFF